MRRQPRGVSHAGGGHVLHAVMQRAAARWVGSARPRTRMPSRYERRIRSGVVQREDVTAGWSLCGSRARALDGARRTDIRGLQRRSEVRRAGGQPNGIGHAPSSIFGTRVPCFYNQYMCELLTSTLRRIFGGAGRVLLLAPAPGPASWDPTRCRARSVLPPTGLRGDASASRRTPTSDVYHNAQLLNISFLAAIECTCSLMSDLVSLAR
jgi:hypothetical protein